jgi:hypothetical protein
MFLNCFSELELIMSGTCDFSTIDNLVDWDSLAATKQEYFSKNGILRSGGGFPLACMNHYHLALAVSRKRSEKVEALGFCFGIRQGLWTGHFHIRKKPHSWTPCGEFGGELLLASHIIADKPGPLGDLSQHQRGNERLGGFRHVRKRPARFEFQRPQRFG